jgi:hypothetical protein
MYRRTLWTKKNSNPGSKAFSTAIASLAYCMKSKSAKREIEVKVLAITEFHPFSAWTKPDLSLMSLLGFTCVPVDWFFAL